MTAKLPEPLAGYFIAANDRSIDAMLASFAHDAVVKDEGQTMRGHAAIRAWMVETARKYQPSFVVVDVNDADGKTVVAAKVSGTFPGSPIQIHFTFRLVDEKIASLEIG
jgi:hypothetical protein